MGTSEQSRPVLTVARLVDNLGSALLEVGPGTPGLDAEVTGVTLVDSVADGQISAGDIVLAAGGDPQALVDRAAASGAAAVVVKRREPVSAHADLAVLGLHVDASWLHVAELIRSVVAVRSGWSDDVRGRGRSEDLFLLAESVSAIVDGPVTIEDRLSRVLAFSGRQDEADPARVETVLGRQVPEHWLALLEKQGVFRRMATERRPIYVDELPVGTKPRVCVGVRAGNELIGSLWAAVDEPLNPERSLAFEQAADIVALHLLQHRVGQDVTRRLQADLIARVLDGGAQAAESASRLRLAGGPLRVIATQFLDDADDAHGEASRQRMRDAVAIQFSVLDPSSATALLGDTIYTVVPVGGDPDGTRAVAVAETILNRLGLPADPLVAVGRVVASFAQLPRSRQSADRVLRVLRILQADRPDAERRRVAQPRDVRLDSLLLRLSDLLVEDDDIDHDAVSALHEYDTAHHTNLVGTLGVYLDALGNVQAAAAQLQLHPNTLRYRLRRITEVSGLDLDDPDARLAATLMVRMARLRET